MNALKWLLPAALLGASACTPHSSNASLSPTSSAADQGQKELIGVYDSRAVAIAYCDSERHKAEDLRLMQALEVARQSGDAERIRNADRALWESRKRLHRQAFSTYPVDNILGQFSQETDLIKRQAGVTLLVSRWDANTLQARKNAKTIDVTERLVQMLTSEERRRRTAMSVVARKPIPPDQYEPMLKQEAGKHY